MAHAASVFYASPFEKATVLTLDNAGDFCCGARWNARGTRDSDREGVVLSRFVGAAVRRSHGMLGFRAGLDEHKIQWLSTSGDERYAGLFREIVSDAARLDPSFFDGHRLAGGGFNAKFYTTRLAWLKGRRFPYGIAPAVARGLQKTIEETVITLAGEGENLCLAGGSVL